MITIYKYPLALTDLQSVLMPFGASILTVQNQNENLCLWAMVDTEREEPEQYRAFRVAGTGHPIEGDVLRERYIGSAQFAGGRLVFHVFEVTGLS